MGVMVKTRVRSAKAEPAAAPVAPLPLDEIVMGDCIAHMRALPA